MFDEIRSVFVYFLEVLAIITFMDSVFSRRFKPNWLYILIPIVASLTVHIANKLTQQYSTLKLFPLALLLLIALVLFKDNVWKRLFCIVAFYAYIYLLDMFVVFVMHLISGETIEGLINSNIYGSFAAVFSKLMLYLSVVIVKNIFPKSKVDHMNWKEWGMLLLTPITSLILIYYLMNEAVANNTISALITILVILLILSNIAIFRVFYELSKEGEMRSENELLQQQVALQAKSFQEIEHFQEGIRQLSHDTNNHFLALKTLIEQKQFETAEDLISDLVEASNKYIAPVKTGVTCVDNILNQKYSLAQDKGINMIFHVNELSRLKINDIDMITILGNLLDNAIEAAVQCNGKRTIELKLLRENNSLIISTRNTVNEKIVINNDEIPTSKSDKRNHGLGIGNIKKVLSKYSANLYLDCDDEWFQASTIIHNIF